MTDNRETINDALADRLSLQRENAELKEKVDQQEMKIAMMNGHIDGYGQEFDRLRDQNDALIKTVTELAKRLR